jgi:hypothetical protein
MNCLTHLCINGIEIHIVANGEVGPPCCYIQLRTEHRHVRLAYQPPASSTFLSEQTSHQQSANNTFISEQIRISHQPQAKRTCCIRDKIIHFHKNSRLLYALFFGRHGASCSRFRSRLHLALRTQVDVTLPPQSNL